MKMLNLQIIINSYIFTIENMKILFFYVNSNFGTIFINNENLWYQYHYYSKQYFLLYFAKITFALQWRYTYIFFLYSSSIQIIVPWYLANQTIKFTSFSFIHFKVMIYAKLWFFHPRDIFLFFIFLSGGTSCQLVL